MLSCSCSLVRPDGRFAPIRSLLLHLLCAGWFLRPSNADTFDIGVKLYTDNNCLFWSQTFLILDSSCYANIWAPNATKGWTMRIVDFNVPQSIDMREYTDDCHSLAMPKRTLVTGTERCTPFLGSMYAQFDIRFRSNTCKGAMCSTLATAVQTFYSAAACAGPAFATFRYPIQNECLRASNGTQDFTVASDDRNITLTDYGGGDECKAQEGVRVRTYDITNRYCYPLYTAEPPRSFSWTVERNTPYAAISTGFRSPPSMLCLLILLLGAVECPAAIRSQGR